MAFNRATSVVILRFLRSFTCCPFSLSTTRSWHSLEVHYRQLFVTIRTRISTFVLVFSDASLMTRIACKTAVYIGNPCILRCELITTVHRWVSLVSGLAISRTVQTAGKLNVLTRGFVSVHRVKMRWLQEATASITSRESSYLRMWIKGICLYPINLDSEIAEDWRPAYFELVRMTEWTGWNILNCRDCRKRRKVYFCAIHLNFRVRKLLYSETDRKSVV